MKKSVRKKKKQELFFSEETKKTIPYKLLMVSLLVLVVLVIAWLGFKVSRDIEEIELGGELGTLKWDFNQTNVVLDVLNYNVSDDNLTIDVNITWSSGNQEINAIYIRFIGIANCHYTQLNDLSFEENKVYSINNDNSDLDCDESNFENVTGVEAYAQIHVNLTQTTLIPNISFYKDDSRENLLDLNGYFYAVVGINYSVVESPDNNKIEIEISNVSKNISISSLDSTWFGSQKFNLTAVSDDGEVLNVNTSGEDMSFYILVLDETRLSSNDSNNAPSFNSTACDDLEWEVNTNYILDMRKCWWDEDGDSLTGFRYENSSSHNRNLTIHQNSTNLTLIPNTNWVGEGYFYLYASDGKNESRGEIDFDVVNTTNATNQTTVNNDPKISSSNPSDAKVYMFPGNKTFSITAGNYTAIKWYLNGGVVAAAGGNLSYEFSNLKDGDIIKVEVINGTRIDSKTWEIKIQKDEFGKEPVFDVGTVIFYLIVVIICIIIFLIVWLFIIEMNKKGRETGIGFGISGSESNVRVSGERGSSLDYFNIPG